MPRNQRQLLREVTSLQRGFERMLGAGHLFKIGRKAHAAAALVLFGMIKRNIRAIKQRVRGAARIRKGCKTN